ncbi:hypothetical protein DERP_012522 [Dermatophagoides pteronyssinus]|uniref:Uncharacterized protein n=1 Tax=Dermatophagoides pteronyssinus TaxID=6956 RepID=A0ABQ8IXC5_DERPT|nr:hypothetical protein DERP_012522 [Dermatophagoides pteronyssinus]
MSTSLTRLPIGLRSHRKLSLRYYRPNHDNNWMDWHSLHNSIVEIVEHEDDDDCDSDDGDDALITDTFVSHSDIY